MSKKEKVKKTGYRIRYAGAHGGGCVVVLQEDPRKGVCEACGKSITNGEIKMTALHHWWYEFQPKTVKENPILATKNTSELCFGCHQVADAIRALLYANPIRVAQVAELLRGEPREKFIRVLDEVSRRLKEQNIDLAKKILEMGKNGTCTS
jgi:hypothetical protein